MQVAQYFKIYTLYCGNQPEAMSFLKASKNNEDLSLFLQYCLLRPECRGLDLGSFLLKPVQRICKYPLLMKELLKHTSESHADFADLKRAYDTINKVVDVVNERRRFVENQQKMIATLAKLEFPEKLHMNHEPSRYFVHEGNLTKNTKGLIGSSASSRWGVLFSDCLVLARPPMFMGSKAQVSKILKVADLCLDTSESESDKKSLCFDLCVKEKTYRMSCATAKERDAWVQRINEVIKDSLERIKPVDEHPHVEIPMAAHAPSPASPDVPKPRTNSVGPASRALTEKLAPHAVNRLSSIKTQSSSSLSSLGSEPSESTQDRDSKGEDVIKKKRVRSAFAKSASSCSLIEFLNTTNAKPDAGDNRSIGRSTGSIATSNRRGSEGCQATDLKIDTGSRDVHVPDRITEADPLFHAAPAPEHAAAETESNPAASQPPRASVPSRKNSHDSKIPQPKAMRPSAQATSPRSSEGMKWRPPASAASPQTPGHTIPTEIPSRIPIINRHKLDSGTEVNPATRAEPRLASKPETQSEPKSEPKSGIQAPPEVKQKESAHGISPSPPLLPKNRAAESGKEAVLVNSPKFKKVRPPVRGGAGRKSDDSLNSDAEVVSPTTRTQEDLTSSRGSGLAESSGPQSKTSSAPAPSPSPGLDEPEPAGASNDGIVRDRVLTRKGSGIPVLAGGHPSGSTRRESKDGKMSMSDALPGPAGAVSATHSLQSKPGLPCTSSFRVGG
ncbi:uncharacterized protein BJ171DRAFT_119008 [Polychytrium aggregatum]|uniref:uncharacterized protein n=1 Tax=Polychytrium aggregatum TaxID=110093 RepID=UPI0022FEC580|nr:uncharacterized protein BJ171DRAFT_119008 [Polychytrium aggregatum]KAI9209512.1 hypothetical protein BJ171DRAFT_119008 [Polychytrium aggregatum]